jgi:hypothetical protein
MRLFKKSLEETLDALNIDQPDRAHVPVGPQISEVLCTRDSYFHSCWLRMKLLRPELIAEMGQIELYIAGMDSSDLEEETEEDEEKESDGTII